MSTKKTNTTENIGDSPAPIADSKPNIVLDGEMKTDKAKLSEKQMDNISNETGRALAKSPKVTIKLHQTRPPQKPLPDEVVTINGYSYQIKRGVSVEVPEVVRDILEEAGRL